MDERGITGFNANIEEHCVVRPKRELPCKDLDLDCLPDADGAVPFGSYNRCYAYDTEQGNCPFIPICK